MDNKTKKPSKLEIMRHSCAHVLAQAVLQIFPQAKLGIGPAIEAGFYYDFDLPRTLVPSDLPKIEERMERIIKVNYSFEKKEVEADKAIELFKKAGQPYKVELIQDLKKEGQDKVTLYKDGDFVDLCAGPHIDSTGEIKAFKLTRISGAYWKGDEKKPMLQRIYGVAFSGQKELKKYLEMLEEAKKRDHIVLGKKLGIFSIDKEYGPGLVLWHPNGAFIRHQIEDYLTKELLDHGYKLVSTPHIAKLSLWKKSGHWEFYREYLYSPFEVEGQKYLLRPMNCLGHVKIFKSGMRSYRDLPLRFAELGTVYRYERSGVLHGLVRVRGFTQDDAHIFCREDQLEDEIIQTVRLAQDILKTFGFKDFQVFLSTRPEKFIGTKEIWGKAEDALEKALKDGKLKYEIDPGEGVFYGPKIDIKIKDALDRAWQCSTIQVDFNLPERFDLFYIDEKSQKKRPIMIHRTLLGSMERFMGVLIEHYGGAFPVWLSPIQVQIIPVSDKHLKYAQKIEKQLLKEELRVKVDKRTESVSKKIHDAEIQKIPYMLVLGDKEMKVKKVNVRERDKKKLRLLAISTFVKKIKKEIEERK